MMVKQWVPVVFGMWAVACAGEPATGTTGGFELVDAENPDVQSAEAIAKAHAAVVRDFGGLATEEEAAPNDEPLPDGYTHLDPKGWVPHDLLGTAVRFFDANKAGFPNQGYISVVDLKPRSDNFRMFVVNLKTGAVERFRTTHGRGDGPKEDADGFAPGFGNVPGSKLSSLGFIRTAEVYFGAYNRSIRLDGLSVTNSNVRARAIVFHGWDDVKEAPIIQMQSAGCVTLDWIVKDAVLDKIKEGSLMYIGLSQ